jgi:hypothetical protein
MTPGKKKWVILCGTLLAFAVTLTVALVVGGSTLKKRFEPYIREQVISYLENRFDSDVELASLHIRIPPTSPVHLLFTAGRGTLARVDGSALVLRQRQTAGFPPILILKNFSFEVDLGAVFDSPTQVRRVTLEGMELTIPPKGERAPFQPASQRQIQRSTGVIIGEIVAINSKLTILPRIAGKNPLIFDITELRLQSAGKDQSMDFAAVLTNPKPPGLIRSKGSFGPWSADDPGDTPLSGNYKFDHADLSVFSAIAGTLNSTGDFKGTLSAVSAKGKASVPDFRLKSSGKPVPLSTEFEVLVDGENGNTILQPVHATLGRTRFTTSGAVIKQNGDLRRSIALDVTMPSGNLNDILRLAMKSTPLMEGRLALKAQIGIPPLSGKVKEKLLLKGQFRISDGRFLRSAIQSRIDDLSRRGQGQPQNEEITEVFSEMNGRFRMEDQTITFTSLSFATEGAEVKLAGDYNLASDALDFHGSLGLRARVSQTMTGWKRWALKPVDPFFARNGVGTFLRIKIDGTSKSPNFGIDHGKKEPTDSAPESTR